MNICKNLTIAILSETKNPLGLPPLGAASE